ncbi:hypothetical protein MQH10_18635 [Phenylobacterium aquaticum]|nr:hypothetical protein [Phenylobacterium aquaticum]
MLVDQLQAIGVGFHPRQMGEQGGVAAGVDEPAADRGEQPQGLLGVEGADPAEHLIGDLQLGRGHLGGIAEAPHQLIGLFEMDGLLRAAGPVEALGQGGHIVAVAGLKLDRLAQMGQGAVAVRVLDDRSQLVLDPGGVALLGDQGVQIGFRLPGPMQVPQQDGLALQGAAGAGIEANGLVHGLEGGVELVALGQGAGQVAPGVDVRRLQGERLTEPFRRLGRPALVTQGRAELAQIVGVVGGLGDQVGEDPPGRRPVALVVVDIAQIDQDAFIVGRAAGQLREGRDGFVIALGAPEHDALEVQAFRIAGMNPQRAVRPGGALLVTAQEIVLVEQAAIEADGLTGLLGDDLDHEAHRLGLAAGLERRLSLFQSLVHAVLPRRATPDA